MVKAPSGRPVCKIYSDKNDLNSLLPVKNKNNFLIVYYNKQYLCKFVSQTIQNGKPI